MPNVRIVLGQISPEWNRTLIEAAHLDRALEIVGVAEDPVTLLMQVEELKADVVILSQLPDGTEPGICSHILLEHPNLCVLLLPTCRRSGAILSLVFRKERLKDASMETLRSALSAR
jgi:DNA-binding NarL/FixJ family response regulator